MNNQQTNNDQQWVKCPAGAIQKVADSAIVEKNSEPAVNLPRRNLLAATATAASVAALGGVAYLTLRQPAANRGPMPAMGAGSIPADYHGGISCVDVMKNLPAYIANNIKNPDKVKSIKEHLEMCDICREVYDYQKIS